MEELEYYDKNAKLRWFLTEEILLLLDPEKTPLPLTHAAPKSPPPSGSLLLYDRKATRFFRKDGHDWVKMLHRSTQVREDNVKLRIDGVFVASLCYAHGESVPTLHRRVYHLLDDKKNVGMPRTSGRRTQGWKNNLVLVHYLDSKEAEAEALRRGLPVPDLSRKRDAPGGRKQTSITGRSLRKGGESGVATNGSLSADKDKVPSYREQQPTTPFDVNPITDSSRGGMLFLDSGHSSNGKHDGDGKVDCTVLLDGASLSELDPGDLESDASAVSADSELFHDAITSREDYASGAAAAVDDVGCSSFLEPTELLPEVVEFNPRSVPIQASWSTSPTTMKVSLSESLPSIPVGDWRTSWNRYAAFLDVRVGEGIDGDNKDTSSTPSLTIREVTLSTLCRVGNLYECDVPKTFMEPSHRAIVLVAVEATPTSGGGAGNSLHSMEEAVARFLQVQCNEALSSDTETSAVDDGKRTRCVRPTFFAQSSGKTRDSGMGMCVLSQLSRDFLAITGDYSDITDPTPLHEVFPADPAPTDAFIQQGLGEDKRLPHVLDTPGNLSHVSEWFAAPRFSTAAELAERSTLSLAEMSSALADIHGFSHQDMASSQRRHKFSMSDGELLAFDACLAQSPDCRKGALLLALKECPELVNRAHKSLFLHCAENNDPRHAAEKYCNYWEARLKCFGSRKAFLPITLNGALRDDMHTLSQVDWVHLIPGVVDRNGRAVTYQDSSRYFPKQHDRDSVLRALWYWYERILWDSPDPAKGLVALARLDNRVLENDDFTLVRGSFEITQAFPYEIRAIHYIHPPWYTSMVFPVIQMFLSKEMRQRVIMHRGSNDQVLSSLEACGIDKTLLPVGIGGTREFSMSNWLLLQMMEGR